MHKISVAIAVYNKEDQLRSTLESVLNQTHPVAEIVIVNDGSTDGSEKIIQSIDDPRIVYKYQDNQGAAAARNQAIKLCSGEFIALLDADDLWEPTYLEEMLEAINRYPDEKVFSCGLLIESKNNKSFPANYSISNHSEIGVYNYFEGSNINSLIYSSNVILHKDVFEGSGYFNPSIKSGEDTDLWIRIGLNFPVVFIPKYLVTYRYISKGLSYKGIPVLQRLPFENYTTQEKSNPPLKKFLDLNRYSLAITAKEMDDQEGYRKLKNDIDLQNLNKKQRFILNLPTFGIKVLKLLKQTLESLGLKASAF